jgi:hypothetical protein
MSRPIIRVAVFVLISLVLIAATFVSVRGSLASTSAASRTASVQAHMVNGLLTNLNHQRSTSSELQGVQTQSQPGAAHQGGCHSDAQNSPQD